MTSFKDFAFRTKKDDVTEDIMEASIFDDEYIISQTKWIRTQTKWLEREKKFLALQIANFKHDKKNMKCEVCEERRQRKQ